MRYEVSTLAILACVLVNFTAALGVISMRPVAKEIDYAIARLTESEGMTGQRCVCGDRSYSLKQVNIALTGETKIIGHSSFPLDFLNNEKFPEFMHYPPARHPDCVLNITAGKWAVSNLKLYPLPINQDGALSDIDRVIKTQDGQFCGCAYLDRNRRDKGSYRMCG